ncbi:Putative enhancer of mRNA-decapping protein [Septoria linicola]|uniref:Enhancer of mRNA-decapping protein n=1 Tax=Septoria linicola TaxID=215465 RepID=A0A9Q9APF6_9PEZI|nr:putative enhancer of mRNA-decapping protein [Septoria linicola]USW49798.1 Putative enhancer of mRNA-decapping protein [Septoria linicola]
MADLSELFSRLKQQNTEHQLPAQSPAAQPPSQASLWAQPSYEQPSVSTPLVSPPIHTPNPHHASNILSPVNPSSNAGTPGPDLNRTNNLLNLLKFNGQSGQQQQQQSQTGAMAGLTNVASNRHTSMQLPAVQPRDGGHSRGETRPLSAADVMANLQRSASGSVVTQRNLTAVDDELRSKSSGNPQDFLLNLLKGPKSHIPAASPAAQTEHTARTVKPQPDVDDLAKQFGQASVDSTASQPAQESTPARQFGSPAASSTPFEAPPGNKASMFSYVNPFDQLHTSSPLNRNRTPQPTEQAAAPNKIEILKHDRSASSTQNGDSSQPAAKSRKIHDDSSSAETKSVSQKLENIGEKVEKQVAHALKAADSREPLRSSSKHTTDDERIKKETANNEDVESNWESAEDDAKEYKVGVYNFPMKPFVSLQVLSPKHIRPVRQDNFMVIAQLKKEFDQIDRALVTATQTHIVYAQVATKKDNGGFRIIRQDSGDHKQVFRSSGERIFNVQLCSVADKQHDVETVLGTGVNGAIFWTSLVKSRGDSFQDDDVEGHGFIMPPVATIEENTSGSPVKTRAKMSSRHPDYFAIARGKHIFLIAPDTVKTRTYTDTTTRRVDSEKYFSDHTLKINTGKAGKDFCFSEDDTVIASLDKNGRFKFWDIRDLTAQASNSSFQPGKHDPVELRDAIWQNTAVTSGSRVDEKPSVSSIMFLDKEKPVNKGSALRYMIIGFKQNHILQLWDLGLGKAVQEIRLPHEKDSDGICSLTYHPKTGIVTIGHPTRNSIYFLHLSAPKYNIPTMEQARYIKMLATNDPTLPKPESTAIMSGLREFSFAKVGQLRSVDMLRTPVENAGENGTEDETLFELYIMHSKGSAGISVKREDLGWDKHSKMVNPKDALKEGVIEVRELSLPKQPSPSTERGETDTAPKPVVKSAKPEVSKEPSPPAVIKSEGVRSPTPRSNAPLPRMTSPEPPTKPLPQLPINPPLITADSYTHAALRAKSPAGSKSSEEVVRNTIISPQAKETAVVNASNAATQASAPIAGAGDYQSVLTRQFDSLYQRIESDKRVQDAAAGAKQDALLRLVSSTLTENVDRSLSSIIATRIEKDVIPTLTDVTSKVVDRKIAESLPPQLNASVAAAMKANLSNTLQQALQDKEVHKAISDLTANQVAQRVQQQVSAMLQKQLPEMTTKAAQKLVGDLEGKLVQHQRTSEAQRQQDNIKIEELSGIVRSLSTTLQGMAASQASFQEQILKLQREAREGQGRNARSVSSSPPVTEEPPAEPEDTDVANMTQLLMDGKYEEATIQWISSDRQAEIFDKLFVRVNPTYLTSLSPLVALTVSAAITSSFDTFISERLDWLTRVLQQIDIRNEDILDVAPKIMDVLTQRLQGAYMAISEAKPSDPALRTISNLSRQVQEIRRVAQ